MHQLCAKCLLSQEACASGISWKWPKFTSPGGGSAFVLLGFEASTAFIPLALPVFIPSNSLLLSPVRSTPSSGDSHKNHSTLFPVAQTQWVHLHSDTRHAVINALEHKWWILGYARVSKDWTSHWLTHLTSQFTSWLRISEHVASSRAKLISDDWEIKQERPWLIKFPIVILIHCHIFFFLQKISLFVRSLFSNVCLLYISQVSPEEREPIGHVSICIIL